MIYGPAHAVEIWASHRFKLLDKHVKWVLKNDPGWGLHSEKFVKYTLFSAIRSGGFKIQEHDTICFFRARSDETVLLLDCDRNSKKSILNHLPTNKKELVEGVIGRKCGGRVRIKNKTVLNCTRND